MTKRYAPRPKRSLACHSTQTYNRFVPSACFSKSPQASLDYHLNKKFELDDPIKTGQNPRERVFGNIAVRALYDAVETNMGTTLCPTFTKVPL